MKLLEIEIDGPHNENLIFAPLQRRISGRFDFNRVKEPRAVMRLQKYPEPFPGERLGVNLETGAGYIARPIHDVPSLKRRIEADGMQLPPAREEFPGVHIPTWLFWMTRAVESGVAKVVDGKLPEEIDGEPVTSFYTTREKPNDRMAAAMEANTAVLTELLRILKSK